MSVSVKMDMKAKIVRQRSITVQAILVPTGIVQVCLEISCAPVQLGTAVKNASSRPTIAQASHVFMETVRISSTDINVIVASDTLGETATLRLTFAKRVLVYAESV